MRTPRHAPAPRASACLAVLLSSALVVTACGRDRAAPSGGGPSAASSGPAAAVSASAAASAAAALSALASASAEVDRLAEQVDALASAGASASVLAPGPRLERLEASVVAPKVPGAADALAKGRWRLRGCALAAAESGASGAPGSVDARFELSLLLDADGRVATVTAQTDAKSALGDCLAEALGKIAFPPPSEEGARAVVTVSLRASRGTPAPTHGDAGR